MLKSIPCGNRKFYQRNVQKITGETILVYCTKCGTLNPDEATNCSNCGAPLYKAENQPNIWQEKRHRHYDEYGNRYRHEGNGIGLLIAGLFIILIGLAALTGFSFIWNIFWPLVLTLLGIWLIIWGIRRTRKYRQPPSQ
jgi:hypothetical protein